MRNVLVLGLIFGIVGLVVGYLIFGRWLGQLVSIGDIFRPADNVLAEFGQSLAGFREMRQNILISGGVGLAFGVVVGLFLNRR